MHNNASDDAEVNAIALEIEQYLAQHPHSKDTLEGIQVWWLEETMPLATISKVEHALEKLVARKVIDKESLPDGSSIYASARKRPVP